MSKPSSKLFARWSWRFTKDLLARLLVKTGGIGVIVAICLIFFYLSVEVAPLFKTAAQQPVASYPVPGEKNTPAETLDISFEGRLLMAARLTRQGQVWFFDPQNGRVVRRVDLALPKDVSITAHYKPEPVKASGNGNERLFNPQLLLLGLSNGEVLTVRIAYEVTLADDSRKIIQPRVDYPVGRSPVDTDDGTAVTSLAGAVGEESTLLVTAHRSGSLRLTRLEKSTSLLDEDDGAAVEITRGAIKQAGGDPVMQLELSKDQVSLFSLGESGVLRYYRVGNIEQPKFMQAVVAGSQGDRIVQMRLLVGGISLITGTASGRLAQWFPLRGQANRFLLRRVREFPRASSSAISDIVPEYRRKGFLAIDQSGSLGIYYSTSNRLLSYKKFAPPALKRVYVSPRGDAAILQAGAGRLQFVRIDNQHPEVSWKALWHKNWYESHDRPKHLWQSSSGSDDFEPKFGLSPLALGTLKAAFYAMLFATPLALLGAIYAAQFMAPRVRRVVKPSIELMEALPTVIIGFLAGLWLAPVVEDNLAGVFLVLLLVPIGIVLFGYYWRCLPAGIRARVPEGWESVLLIPVILLLSWLVLALIGPGVETLFFNGSLSGWLQEELGIPYRQRNAVVVGLAMGMAVIPTIFSIAEDALFAVPKHLIHGSLALGATPWQTLRRVVLLTASPGIFSAVMIGFGRAVGETMIVLMATGNTPVMDFSPFQGMRTFSANIAVEIPESEYGSTHYRVLFLTALILFLFTFFFNTIAETVRHRLRKKYSSL